MSRAAWHRGPIEVDVAALGARDLHRPILLGVQAKLDVPTGPDGLCARDVRRLFAATALHKGVAVLLWVRAAADGTSLGYRFGCRFRELLKLDAGAEAAHAPALASAEHVGYAALLLGDWPLDTRVVPHAPNVHPANMGSGAVSSGQKIRGDQSIYGSTLTSPLVGL